MNLVVDASVVAKWLFVEPDTAKARAIFAEFERGRLTLLAPEILPAEIGSVLLTRVLCGMLEENEAQGLYSQFQGVCPDLDEISGLMQPALQLAIRFRHSVYDSLYVALAERERCELLTADEGMYRAFKSAFLKIRLLRDWS